MPLSIASTWTQATSKRSLATTLFRSDVCCRQSHSGVADRARLQGSYSASEIPTNGTHLIIPSLQGEPISFYRSVSQTRCCHSQCSQASGGVQRDENGTTGLIGQNATVLSNTTVQNLLLKVIPRVLTIPGPIPEVLVSNSNGTDLVELSEQYLPVLVSRLNDTSSNFTFFAPTNQAISDAQSDLDSLIQSGGNQSLRIVQGHILNQGE